MIDRLRSITLRLSIAALAMLASQGHRGASGQDKTVPLSEGKKAAEGDLGRLQGRWSCRTGAGDKLVVTWDFSVGKIVMTEDASALGENYGKQLLNGTYTVREGADPKEIDVTFQLPGSDEKAPPLRAIYILDGDRLKLCYGRPGSERPTRFPEDPKTVRPQDEPRKLLDLRRVTDKNQ
ncbi:TIGR03067 domain-containing protein [Singulisphaera sp. Ch08]|uniref:TIGR03067 domain-containing protein n=1 Tax=Singulisphaera sp. Ch08 TaxID=3120278 RepID=A0AAU7CN38_9BACT